MVLAMSDKEILPQLSKSPDETSSAMVVLDSFVDFASSRCQDAGRWRDLVSLWRSLVGKNRHMMESSVRISRS
jgi:hypothetical protein